MHRLTHTLTWVLWQTGDLTIHLTHALWSLYTLPMLCQQQHHAQQQEALSCSIQPSSHLLLCPVMQSVYGIARTMYLACLLAVGAMLIHQDTYKLVLQPVQRMVERVKEMAEDPLMLAAVRITAAPQKSANSNNDAADKADESAGVTNGSMVEAREKSAVSKSDMLGARNGSHTSSGGRLGVIRFWPPIQVHAVAGDSEGDVAHAAAEAASQHLNARSSLVLVAGAATRRLSAGVMAGVTAAGNVAARLKSQLAQRTSAIRHLMVDDRDNEAAQVWAERCCCLSNQKWQPMCMN